MIKWEYYSRRRNINLVSYIKKWDIENYEQLVNLLASKGIAPPSTTEFEIAHKIALPPIEPKPKAKKRTATKPKTQPARKRGRPRKTKG